MDQKSDKIDTSTPIDVEQGMRLEDAPSTPKDNEKIKAAEGLNPRKAKLDAIYANRLKEIEKESNFGAELVKDSAALEKETQNPEPESASSPDETDNVAIERTPADDKTNLPVQEQITDNDPVTEKLYTLKVDGVDLRLTEQQLIDRAQKGIGAEKRFEEARRLNEEAKQFIYGQPSQPQAPVYTNSALQGHPAVSEPLPDAVKEDFLNKLNFGSKDEQKKALDNLVSTVVSRSPTPASPDIGQIVNAATQNAINAMQSQQTIAVLGNEFSDVFSDKILSKAAGDLTNELGFKYMQAGVPKNFYEVSKEALSTIRNKYLKSEIQSNAQPTINSAAARPDVIQMDNKVAAKRAAPKPIVAVNATAKTEPTKPALKSGVGKSDTVSFMRQSRGQPLYS